MLKDKIINLIKTALEKAGYEQSFEKISLAYPADSQYGDYASNIAFVLAKQKGKNPRLVAEAIIEEFKKLPGAQQLFEKIEVAGAGFINFYLSPAWLINELGEIVTQGNKYGKAVSVNGNGKLIIEYTDPNPFKQFHIGHLYSNTVGESLARLHEAQGWQVKRANYQGDVGMHVAKALWGMLKKFADETITLEILSKKPLPERVEFLGKAYALGATAYEEDPQAKKRIQELNFLGYASGQKYRQEKAGKKPQLDYLTSITDSAYRLEDIYPLWRKGREWSLEYFEQIYKRLGTSFDYYYFESQCTEEGLALAKELLDKGLFEKGEDEAIIFKADKYGLHTRVFVNSFGLPTYEAKDLALASIKYRDYQYDFSIIITGNEVDEYFKVVFKALEQISPELAQKNHHLSHGMVRLPQGKLSSRTGSIVTSEWLLDEVKKRVLAIMNASASELTDKEKQEVAEIVTVGAIKYALLKRSIGGDITFEFGESISFEGNAGPYLQYTHARIKSILRKADKTSFEQLTDLSNYSFQQEELLVLRWLSRFSEVVKEAAQRYAPSAICNYLYELSQHYNAFYNTHLVLQADTLRQKSFRLFLSQATAQVIQNGLALLGIQAPEKM